MSTEAPPQVGTGGEPPRKTAHSIQIGKKSHDKTTKWVAVVSAVAAAVLQRLNSARAALKDMYVRLKGWKMAPITFRNDSASDIIVSMDTGREAYRIAPGTQEMYMTANWDDFPHFYVYDVAPDGNPQPGTYKKYFYATDLRKLATFPLLKTLGLNAGTLSYRQDNSIVWFSPSK